MSDANNYYGPLWKWENGQPIGGMYIEPDPAQTVGYISIVFHDSRHATITCCDGTVVKDIERFEFPAFEEHPKPNPEPDPEPEPNPPPQVTLPEVSYPGTYILRQTTIKANGITLHSGIDFVIDGMGSFGPSTYTQEITFDGFTIKTTGTYWIEWTAVGAYDVIMHIQTSYGANHTMYVDFDGYFAHTYGQVYVEGYGWAEEWDTWEKISDSY